MVARPHRPIRSLALFGILLVAAIIVGVVMATQTFRDRELINNERELKNTALILAEQTDRTIQSIDLVLTSVTERVQSLGIFSPEDFWNRASGQDMQSWLKDKISGLPHISAVSMFDTDGRLINLSRFWPVPNLNIADRKYFLAFKSNPTLNSLISEPVINRASGTWTVFLVRRLTSPDGKFLGVINGAMELAYYENLFGAVVLNEHSSISLQHNDGALLARYPRLEAAIGAVFKGANTALGGSDNGTARLIGKMDGKDRLLAAHRLPHYPLVIAVTTDADAALAGWRNERNLLIGAGAFSILAITIVFILIVRQLSRGHRWSKERLALEKLRLDTAINNMSQGLLLFDASEQIVVCNQRYIEMYGLSPDVVKPGCSLRDLILHRKECGTFDGNIDEYRSSVLGDLAQGKVSESIIEPPDGRSIRVVNQPLANGGWVATHEDITERKRSDERIARLAHYDALTDLPNRVQFRERLEQSLKRVSRGERLALLYLDLDQFKTINDTLGHWVGDELLKIVAGRLRACLRETDIVARLSGDEFAIIQCPIAEPGNVIDLATRIHEALKTPCVVGGHPLAAEASIGIALAPNDGTDSDQLLLNADLAMYAAKAERRGLYCFFEPAMDAQVKARRKLEVDLREAVMCESLELHYQPLVDLHDNKIVGCESLLRWRHGERGMIPPTEFIPLAEETGLIIPLGEWVLRTACAEVALWPEHVKVSVNVSPVQFKTGDFVQMVIDALEASGLPARRLELEITEAVLIGDDEAALSVLHQLRTLGVRIALDDFGTGYSSLSYLQRFPFDRIKIDRSFVKDVTKVDGSLAIVQAVISIAKSRNMTTTAEGVETEDQSTLLRALGCTEMQGFLFSPAIPAADFLRLILAHRERILGAA